MTTEHEFGRFTQGELDQAVQAALLEERDGRLAVLLVWLTIGMTTGAIWTLVWLLGLHCFNRETIG